MTDIVVIGAGGVGLGCAYYLRKDGHAVTVVDRDPEGDKASFGNAGGIGITEVVPAAVPGVFWRIPRWLFDPLGPLSLRPSHAPRLIPWLLRFSRSAAPSEVRRISAALAALNLRVYDDLVPMLAETGLSGELFRKGALSVYETDAGFERDRDEWALKRSLGIETAEISGDEARRMEPALGPIVRRAIVTPQWGHVTDPKRIVDGLRRWLMANGVKFEHGEAAGIATAGGARVALADGRKLTAGKVIVAAGAWSGQLASGIGDRVLLESERGYNTTLPAPGVTLAVEVIFAERKFTATPLSIGLRIGGAAEFAGLTAAPNYRRSRALVTLARRYLPGLSTDGGTEWMGHRPATPDSLPVIGPSLRHRDILYAFGHGHVGLTLAATTGRLIADHIAGRPSVVDLTPYSIARFR
ncbi:MAG TPA: FAD-dependent oxidoreductase [Stellaceae bacterium]|nr:FAD-dependent oxidoreductase [Stellaceae bacterium]